jgi:hypothetical protein
VNTLQKNEHLAVVDQATAPVGTAPADDLDIAAILRRTPEDRAPGASRKSRDFDSEGRQ